jgi:hypothetical protein
MDLIGVGSRKFWTSVFGVILIWVVAKFGPTWGGVFQTAIPTLVIVVGTVGYYIYNYIQKTTADTFVPENWLSGKRTVINLLLTFIAPMITAWSTEAKDLLTQSITFTADAAVPFFCMIFQSLSDKKLKINESNGATAQSTTGTTQYDYLAGPPNTSAQSTEPVTPAISYTYIDANELKARYESKYSSPMDRAYQFRAAVLNIDLRRCSPSDRVRQSKEMKEASKALFNEAFVKYTGGSAVPTTAELGNIHVLGLRVKQDYEKINNIVCSNKTFEELKALINTMEDFVRMDQGEALIGNSDSASLNWKGTFGESGMRPICPFDTFEYAAGLISKSNGVSPKNK